MKKKILIIGGSAGLGLELARHYVNERHTVCITGRQDPGLAGAQFVLFDIGCNADALAVGIDDLLTRITSVNMLIYSAGFCQRGLID